MVIHKKLARTKGSYRIGELMKEYQFIQTIRVKRHVFNELMKDPYFMVKNAIRKIIQCGNNSIRSALFVWKLRNINLVAKREGNKNIAINKL
mmetsp:Transcript_3551/g.2134  ORF Transcript_3551/g.2134 Transcript_3551/m.2134 type:complete len:92 (+) Transcript_3551:855-1130(+)